MVCNQAKTEFIIFNKHKRFKDKRLVINNVEIRPTDKIWVLGMMFQDNLKWTSQINKAISLANEMVLPIRYVNRFVTRPQFKMVVNAHFISRLMFGSCVWKKAISA